MTGLRAFAVSTGLGVICLSVACASSPEQMGSVESSEEQVGSVVTVPVESSKDGALLGLRTRIEYGTETDQFGLLQLPDGPAPDTGFPVVVLIHGGFWRQGFGASLMDGLAADLADRGYASWNIEYSRVGGAGGWPATGDDVSAAIDFLAELANEQPIDSERVVSVGHSAGGHLALWALGHQSRLQVRGAVGLGAVVDLAFFPQAHDLLGGTVEQVPATYIDAAPVLDPERVVLIQGSLDGIVPAASLGVAEDAGITVVSIDGDDHFDLIDPMSASWAATLDVVEQFLIVPS